MSDEGPLPLARRRLADAVHSLADPWPVWDGGACQWVDSTYARLRDALHGGNVRRSGSQRSTPCRVDVLALLVEIDATVCAWGPDGKGTADRLRLLADHGWRPKDCSLIDDMCDQLERWAVTAAELLGDTTTVVALRLPCPSCGARFVGRRNAAGEVVQSWALRVSEDGCTCSGCGVVWPPGEFHFLARLLGCEPLPA